MDPLESGENVGTTPHSHALPLNGTAARQIHFPSAHLPLKLLGLVWPFAARAAKAAKRTDKQVSFSPFQIHPPVTGFTLPRGLQAERKSSSGSYVAKGHTRGSYVSVDALSEASGEHPLRSLAPSGCIGRLNSRLPSPGSPTALRVRWASPSEANAPGQAA